MTHKKKAIVFGGTDGHGATMTIISEKNLIEDGYCVETGCQFKSLKREQNLKKGDLLVDSGTGSPEFFWGSTFLHYDYSRLKQGDVVVVVDIPLPIRQNLAFSAADEGIKKIHELTGRGIRVLLFDHHKRAITHYGDAIAHGAEVIFSLAAEPFCHYGVPDEFSLFWGRIGAICDRDPSMLPVETDEEAHFEEMERYAAWVDQWKRDLTCLIGRIRYDQQTFPEGYPSPIPLPQCRVDGSICIVERLHIKDAFKQLDSLCAENGTHYGIGITNDCSAILAINYWKTLKPVPKRRIQALPIAVHLSEYRTPAGHDTAITLHRDDKDCEKAKSELNDILDLLKGKLIKQPKTLPGSADTIDYIASIFQEIPTPFYLTIHGWFHVETVMDNTKVLGMLSSLSDKEQKLLNLGALFHDIGNGAMELQQEYNLTVKDDDEAREKHEEYTVEILKKMKEKGLFDNLLDDDEFDIVTTLCYCHRKKNPLPEDPAVSKLCSLLRIADALDKTKNRARYNDDGVPYSEFKKDLKEKKPESIPHWEGQLDIEAIRLHVTVDRIIFEFIIHDWSKSGFMIDDFMKELIPLQGIIPPWSIRVTWLPEINTSGSNPGA